MKIWWTWMETKDGLYVIARNGLHVLWEVCQMEKYHVLIWMYNKVELLGCLLYMAGLVGWWTIALFSFLQHGYHTTCREYYAHQESTRSWKGAHCSVDMEWLALLLIDMNRNWCFLLKRQVMHWRFWAMTARMTKTPPRRSTNVFRNSKRWQHVISRLWMYVWYCTCW